MKGKFRLDAIARGNEYVALSGLYKPVIGAEQHAELILSEEDWQKIISNVGWEQVSKAISQIRENLQKPKRNQVEYICPSCGEPRKGHEKPDYDRTPEEQTALEAARHSHSYDGTDPLCTTCGDLRKAE